MKLTELLHPSAIISEMESTSKIDVLAELTDSLLKVESGLDRDEVVKVLVEREKLGSTGIGEGVAIPHGKLKDVDQLLISFGRSRKGVDFDSMDGRPAHLFFLLVAPEDSVGIHLKTLARISKLLRNPSVRQRLLNAPGPSEIYDIIAEEEEKI